MIAKELKRSISRRQAVFGAIGTLTMVLAGSACNAPISTMRSPYHLRVVEVRNTTGAERVLTIMPLADQHLGAATTFTGMLRPGEVKVLYLYHGFEYRFAILDRPQGETVMATGVYDIDRDIGLEFAGDSLVADGGTIVILGEPSVTESTSFADSMMEADPFGIRGRGSLGPDTTRGQVLPVDADQRDRIEREREIERQRRGDP